jgi:hypothetical protein
MGRDEDQSALFSGAAAHHGGAGRLEAPTRHGGEGET